MVPEVRQGYDRQQRVTASAVAQAERVAPRGPVAVAEVVRAHQAASVVAGVEAVAPVLAAQGLSGAVAGGLVVGSLLTGGAALVAMLGGATSPAAFVRLVETLVVDARRTGRVVDLARRPAVTGYVRSVRLPSCSRCVVLAGRVYRFSEGFDRHPLCDCEMTPVGDTVPEGYLTDVDAALAAGQVRGLSEADMAAVSDGVDLGRVVNVRRRAAGLRVGSSVTVRAGRLTPEGCLRAASNRAEALVLLRRFGYLT